MIVHHLARHVSCLDTLYTQHFCTPSSPPTLAPRRLITSLIHCEDPLPPQECGSYPELPPATGSTTRSLMTRRTCSSLEMRIVSNPCLATSRFYLQPKTPRKASRRHTKRTSRTNKLVLCWLHHGTYRSEKQVQNDLNFITLIEKA